jgi:hypothetical protein
MIQPRLNNVLFEMFRCKFIGNDPYISCDPCLRHHKLGPQDRFLVLSSDGLYQYLTNEEVVSHVEWFMERSPDGDPAQRLIEELLFRAAKKNGKHQFCSVSATPRSPLCHCFWGTNVLLSPVCRMCSTPITYVHLGIYTYSVYSKNVILQEVT